MKDIVLNCFKAAPALPLNSIAGIYQMERPSSREKYLVLEGKQLEQAIKKRAESRKVYFFEFGPVVFADFGIEEIRLFLGQMESITGRMDATLTMGFGESHTIVRDSSGGCRLWPGAPEAVGFDESIVTAAAAIIAKSAALSSVEREVSLLLDQAENFLNYLNKGWLRTGLHKFTGISARLLKFEYEGSGTMDILDRSPGRGRPHASREAYCALSDYYELEERFGILSSKIRDLRGIIKAYGKLRYNRSEKRLLVFEIFLLCLFPVSYLIRYLLGL